MPREDTIITNPYFPCKLLQDRGLTLNVVHFWHDKE